MVPPQKQHGEWFAGADKGQESQMKITE